MRVKYRWDPRYPRPNYWNTRTPLTLCRSRLFNLYVDLNDKKVRVFLKTLKGRILDGGCGTGRFIGYADVGIDFSSGMLKRARARFPDRDFVRASLSHLPFKDKAFAASFTVDVLIHIQLDKRKNALKELERVADDSYNFLSEHRTVIPYLLEFLWSIPIKLIIHDVSVFFAFPVDRLRELKIDSADQILAKLTR